MEFDEISSGKKVFSHKSGGKKKDKWLLIGGGVFVLLFIFMYLRQSKSEGTVSIQGAYASYPDSVTNANVIIDSLQQSIDYQTEQIADMLGDMNSGIYDQFEGVHDRFDNTNELINDRFDATNDFINDGLESIKDRQDMDFDSIMGSIDDLNSGLASVSSSVSSSVSAANANHLQELDYIKGLITERTPTSQPSLSLGYGNLNTDYNEAINSQLKDAINSIQPSGVKIGLSTVVDKSMSATTVQDKIENVPKNVVILEPVTTTNKNGSTSKGVYQTVLKKGG